MFTATGRAIRRLLGLQRPKFRETVERVGAECAGMTGEEIVALAAAASAAGDASRTAALLSVAAERGDTEAQFRLGGIFMNGEVPTERFPKGEVSYRMQRAGVRWLTEAAQAGHSEAAARLAAISLIDADIAPRSPPPPARSDGGRA